MHMWRTTHCVLEPVLAAALSLTAPAVYPAGYIEPSAARWQELTHLVRHDCGACHGLRLTGGLGPALDPQALRDKPAASLTQVVLHGRPGTAMPGWQPFLTEREAQWIVEALMKGLPDARESK